jgi:hypothetical protein
MPAFAEQDWELVWSIGAVKDVAIEFNGEWRINPKKRFYELFTEETPYIFFTDNSNNLYVQKWNDVSTRIPLAAGASQISVCRGWQSTLDTESTRVYYRISGMEKYSIALWVSAKQR